jgi:hypothetical protein
MGRFALSTGNWGEGFLVFGRNLATQNTCRPEKLYNVAVFRELLLNQTACFKIKVCQSGRGYPFSPTCGWIQAKIVKKPVISSLIINFPVLR